MVRIATLLAAALIAASSPIDDHGRRFALGVLRRDGLLLPFASYDGSWSVPWPYGLVDIPISVSDVPKKWWGAAGPEARWTAWLPENAQRPLALQKIRTTSVFCDPRLGIQTDYVGPPFNPREPTAPKDGVAIAGDEALLPITTVAVNSPDAKALVKTITDDFNDEERLASRRFTQWKHPYNDAQRRTFPIQMEAIYRAHEKTNRGEWDTIFVEAVRAFPPRENDDACGLITFAHGWVRQQAGKEPDVDLGARVTYCDREGVSFMQPFGQLRVGDDLYWVYQLSSWRDEAYVVSRVRAKESRPVVVVTGGSCPQ